MKQAQRFVDELLRHVGERYSYGAEVTLQDPNAKGPWDCSELIEYAARQIGLSMPDGSSNQARQGIVCTLTEARGLAGALVFRSSPRWHVGVSLGDGRVVEARDSIAGVVISEFDTGRVLEPPGRDRPTQSPFWQFARRRPELETEAVA
jgi:cell wall-associated NlpC family hydrolase